MKKSTHYSGFSPASHSPTRVPFFEVVEPQPFVGSAIASALWSTFDTLERAAKAAWRRYRAYKTEKALLALDDATLKDIGVYRSEIQAVALESAKHPNFSYRDLPR